MYIRLIALRSLIAVSAGLLRPIARQLIDDRNGAN